MAARAKRTPQPLPSATSHSLAPKTTDKQSSSTPSTDSLCHGCRLVIAVSTTTFGEPTSPTSFAVYYALRVDSTAARSDSQPGCMLSTGTDISLSPASSIMIPPNANTAFFSSAGSSIVAGVGTPQCPGNNQATPVGLFIEHASEESLGAPATATATATSASSAAHTASSVASPTSGPAESGLSAGAKTGVAVGVVAVVVFMLTLAALWLRRYGRRRSPRDNTPMHLSDEKDTFMRAGLAGKPELAASSARTGSESRDAAQELPDKQRHEMWANTYRPELLGSDAPQEMQSKRVRRMDRLGKGSEKHEGSRVHVVEMESALYVPELAAREC